MHQVICTLKIHYYLLMDRVVHFKTLEVRVIQILMVGDTIWTSRLHGTSPVIALNAEMYADRKALRDARQKMDDEIIAYMEGLSDSDMAGDVTYKTTSGDPFTMARSVILQHFFNHHAHHRGRRTAC